MRPERIVESGYDKMFREYHKYRGRWKNTKELNDFAGRLRTGSTILDVGCGSGIIAKILASRGYSVTGIDVSKNMLKLARKNVPQARFRRMSMTRLMFHPSSFDGVACLYSMIHVPKERHMSVLRKMNKIVKPRGLLLINMGLGDYTGTEENWLGTGAKMYWSHFGKETNLKLIEEAGFRILWSRPSGRREDNKHLFVLAEKAE